MALREVDAISDAIIETEREIAGAAWDQEETERTDVGDRSLEEMGGGLEGQAEPEDDDDAEGDETEGDADSEGEDEAGEKTDGKAGETEGDGKVAAGKDGNGEEPKPELTARTEQQPEGRVPSGKLREANERARALQGEIDQFKTKDEQRSTEFKTVTNQLKDAMRRIDDLTRAAPRVEPKPAEPKAETVPDIFEDPKGFVEHLTKGFETELAKRDVQISQQRVENSFALSHGLHKESFEKAYEAINKLDPRSPDDRSTVQRIYNSANPGEALVTWHKRNEALVRVGNDPAAYEDRIRSETREALLKDPEFKKQLLADMRAQASQGDDGTPRTQTRLPKSLARAGGSNIGAERGNSNVRDDSEQSVADAAWR